LKICKRGHSRRDTENAVRLLKSDGYEIGLQIMVGLPGDRPTSTFSTAERIINLRPDFVRIYPTLVLAGSPLAKWFQSGEFKPLSLKACIRQVKQLFLRFDKYNIPVVRMGLQASEDLADGSTILAGPYHPAFGHLVHAEIFFDGVHKAMAAGKVKGKSARIRVHPNNVSRLRGLNNGNIKKLNKMFQPESIHIIPDSSIAKNNLMVNGRSVCVYY
jgi:histone acetyltransferase (RNA polymerase elongator complex component)